MHSMGSEFLQNCIGAINDIVALCRLVFVAKPPATISGRLGVTACVGGLAKNNMRSMP